MALGDNELVTSASKSDSNKRVIARSVKVKKLAAGAGDDLDEPLPLLTPMAKNSATGFWVPWDANGANATDEVKGFLWPDEYQLTADESLAQILMAGDVHYDDILEAVETRGVEVEADLITELQTINLRQLGLIITGLAGVP